MIVLDEKVRGDQGHRLKTWGISFRHIGSDLGRAGMSDADILPLLQKLSRPTFFTADGDFYRRSFCHARYCIVYLEVRDRDVALFIRRVLRYPSLRTRAARMGSVARASCAGLSVWRLHASREEGLPWAGP